MKLEMPKNFEDVAVEFSSEEWKMLSEQDKELYREVMVQNYKNMISLGYNVPLYELLLLLKKDKTIPAAETEGRTTVQQTQLPSNRTSITRNGKFSVIQGLRSSHGKLWDAQCNRAQSDEMLITRQDPLKTEARHDNCRQSKEDFVIKTEFQKHLQTEAEEMPCSWLNHSNTGTFYSNNVTDHLRDSGERQKNTPPTHKQALIRQDLHEGIMNAKGFTDGKNLALQKITRTGQNQKVHTGQKSYKCTTCDKSFVYRGRMLNHQTHCGQKSYKCTTCDKSFMRKNQLTHHQKMHSEQESYKCAACDKSFIYKSKMLNHQIHCGQQPYKCTKCGKNFVEKNSMTIHQMLHSGEKPYKCTMCDKSFVHKGSMMIHQRIHSGQKKYKCTMCDKSFVHKHSMMIHQRVHSGQRPYKCTMCDKSFTSKNCLMIHNRIHSGQKPYKCTICDKTFRHNSNVKSHQRLHSGQKPYKCTMCDKSFAAKKYLVIHNYTHTGQKPYKCTMCDKSFVQKSSMTIHQRLHNGQQSTKTKKIDWPEKSHKDDRVASLYKKDDIKCWRCDLTPEANWFHMSINSKLVKAFGLILDIFAKLCGMRIVL
ncbi:zinc finger protein 182-like [Protopterus annectens]|uniref:zinc finger protein 182-like n=1 Tax=Protopterus annectens TaxID=7888 RepID=UPI001CF9FE6D|nr:zinc finger protein 182-like [Protopterus annectens]